MTRLLAVLALVLVLAGCRVDAIVEADVAEDGSGTVAVGVSFDDEALDLLGGDLAEALALDDVEAAGWTVAPPGREADGLTWVRASKPFADPEQFGQVMDELGPFRDMRLERSRALGRTTWSVSGVLDLSDGLATFGDDELEALVGSPVGIDEETLEEQIGPLADAGTVTFSLRLPGSVDANSVDVGASDGRSVWVASLGDDPVEIEATATQLDPLPIIAAVVAALLLVVFVVVVVRMLWRAARRSDDADGAEAGPGSDGAAPAGRQLELIVVDTQGVLFDADADVLDLLVPFVAENGGTDDAGEVAERYREASLGRLSTTELWEALGVEGTADHLDHEYIALLPLDDGALTFLERATMQGFTVACLANGVARWVELLRERDSLDVYIESWVISSEIGVRKPDPAAYEALRRITGVPLANCLMIDDRVEHLDAAARAGMSTALFGVDETESDHPPLPRFDTLFS